MFRASSAHLQEDIVVYMRHMVPSLSIRVPGGLSVHSLSNNEFSWYVVPSTLLVGDLVTEELLPDHRPATYRVQHTPSCIAQSKARADGQNCCPKHVELNWIYQQTIIFLDVSLSVHHELTIY
jgi:hypothetical protein